MSASLVSNEEYQVACPYFMPVRRLENGTWPHPARLPLGAGWEGYCTAPGYEGAVPENRELHEGCNLGYAATCPRLPAERAHDAVRFSVISEGESVVRLAYVCERGHLPAAYGKLEYEVRDQRWVSRHEDRRVQRMAECFLESWLAKREPGAARSRSEKVS